MISLTGLIVPSALETWASATHLRARRQQPLELVETQFAGVGDRHDAQAGRRVSSQSICQGTILEWCSIQVMTISSPA